MRAFLTISLLILAAAIPAFAQKERGRFVGDEILVKFERPADADAVHRAAGSTVLEDLRVDGWKRVRVPAGMTVDEAIARYRGISGVAAVQPNYYYSIDVNPNDPGFGSLYGLTKISAPAAWDLTTGSSSVVVAVIDSGIRYTHQDLAANIWTNSGEIQGNGVDDDANGFVDDVRGWDFFYNDNDPADQNGHGTHTAGTIGAVGNNALGVVGVNWNVKILPIKIYSPSGVDSTSAMLVNAYNYVTMMKNRGVNIRVTSNSYGGCGEACGYDQATKDALDAMGNAGILNVFSAGNSNTNTETTPHYPGSYTSPSIITVAASDANDVKAGFSSFGPNSVDLTAPGVSILSTYSTTDTTTSTLSGTSMSAPHVSGAAALLAALNPNLSVASLKATLLNTVDVLPAWNGVVKTGGRLNADRALRNQTVCTFNAGPTMINVPTRGGVFTLDVASQANCDYEARATDKWISVVDRAPKSGSGTVTFRVGLNRGITRVGTFKIGDTTITVRQSRIPG